MSNIKKDSFSYLGIEFQLRLISQVIQDHRFADSIIEILNPNYFEDQYLKIIVSVIKEAHEKNGVVLDFGSLEFRLLDKFTTEFERKYGLAQLKAIKEASSNDCFEIQERAIKFCKHQELKKSIKKIEKIIDTGDIEKYDECEVILKKALEYGHVKDGGIDLFENIETVLSDDYRTPIPTGISGLDMVMNGGLSKGELGVILAPFGVGKTTILTKFANTAFKLGYKVLQIVFEDKEKIIQRKHLSCFTNIPLNDLGLHKNLVIDKVKEMETNGKLVIKKFHSDGTTIPLIKQYIKKLIGNGFKPDLIILDYIDCVEASKAMDDQNAAEGKIMRQFESLLSEFDAAGWTAVQGNRSSIRSEIVESDQMGGSIKRGQIGHFIMSIAKTLDQKENHTANIAILKSRFGKDGIVFTDILFDNSRIQIDMDENNNNMKTRTEIKKEQDVSNQNKVKEILERYKQKREEINKQN